MDNVQKLSTSFSGALRLFSFWVANGTLGYQILNGIDYRPVLMKEPSALEQLYAIFANVIELDDAGIVQNAKTQRGELLSGFEVTSNQPTKCCLPWSIGRWNFTALHLESIRRNQAHLPVPVNLDAINEKV